MPPDISPGGAPRWMVTRHLTRGSRLYATDAALAVPCRARLLYAFAALTPVPLLPHAAVLHHLLLACPFSPHYTAYALCARHHPRRTCAGRQRLNSRQAGDATPLGGIHRHLRPGRSFPLLMPHHSHCTGGSQQRGAASGINKRRAAHKHCQTTHGAADALRLWRSPREHCHAAGIADTWASARCCSRAALSGTPLHLLPPATTYRAAAGNGALPTRLLLCGGGRTTDKRTRDADIQRRAATKSAGSMRASRAACWKDIATYALVWARQANEEDAMQITS